jgi:uncharacterized membrane protein YbhN (UPF0104 family)
MGGDRGIESAAPHPAPWPEWIHTLQLKVLQRKLGSSARYRGLGVVVSITIAALAIFALMHALKDVNYDEVLAIVKRTDAGVIALALALVVLSYLSLTVYDFLALRTIGRSDVPYSMAALASFTSYPISHGIGAVALVSPVIRYRIYAHSHLNMVEVANICFLTGLTFWLGNLTALGLSLSCEPGAVSLMDHLPPQATRLVAAVLLLGVLSFLIWSWVAPRRLGPRRWPVRLPSGPMVLLQIGIGIVDLGAAALAMYVLIPGGMDIGFFRLTAVFIAATLLGFASHSPAGLGVFDAAILIGLAGENREALLAVLLTFRFLYHLLPFLLALALLCGVEGWRSFRAER